MKPGSIVRDIRLPLDHSERDLVETIARRSRQSAESIIEQGFHLTRQSIDARRKSDIRLVYSVKLGSSRPRLTGLAGLVIDRKQVRPGQKRPVVVGAGPAGLFAALTLAMNGLNPLLIEQGRPVDKRQLDVEAFWSEGILNPLSNVQFGEGGAGTFSDGKLTSGIKDSRCRAVLEEMVLAGAPQDILILPRPHVGTDRLRDVVRQIRQKIISLGGDVRFNTKLTGIEQSSGRLTGIQIETWQDGECVKTDEFAASQLILAIGHSARPTFEWLSRLPIAITPKPFSMGVRIEHHQLMIDRIQYGPAAGHPRLVPAEYKLACHLPSGRSVYTFCMCPGGQVVAASSETGGVVTNGMSLYARDKTNANSALLVNVDPTDFPDQSPLGGMFWQQEIEQAAFDQAGSDYCAPAQLVGDFLDLAASVPGTAEPAVQPSYLPGVKTCDLSTVLPALVTDSLREALPLLERKMPGFSDSNSVLTAPETRSSSPIRLVRDQALQTAIHGLFPCGEGSGYAGGITSSAVDGVRCAQALIEQS